MLKRSLLATTAILACTLFASQAQAVTQTIQWDFAVTFTNTPSKTFDSTGLPTVPGWTIADDDVILSGGATTSPSQISSPVISQIQGNTTGVGVVANGATTTIDQSSGSPTSYDFVRIDLAAPLAFIAANSLTGTWAIDLSGLTGGEAGAVLTSTTPNSATSALLATGQNTFTNLSGTVQQYLFVRQDEPASFQLSGLRFTYDDGCPVGGCVTTPEPGILGLLGFSLFGLAFLRKRK